MYTVDDHWQPEVKRLLEQYFPARTGGRYSAIKGRGPLLIPGSALAETQKRNGPSEAFRGGSTAGPEISLRRHALPPSMLFLHGNSCFRPSGSFASGAHRFGTCIRGFARNPGTSPLMRLPQSPNFGTHGFANSGDVRIHYVTKGSGPLVVMIHGFPDYWYSWRYQMPALARQFQVVAMDQRGSTSATSRRVSPNTHGSVGRRRRRSDPALPVVRRPL